MAHPYGYGAPGGYGTPGMGVPVAGFSAPGMPAAGYAAPGMMGGMGGMGGMPMGGGMGMGFNPYATPGYAPANPVAWALFTAVDVDRSGSISEKELQMALSNGGWTPFSPRTTRMLMHMFDGDRSGAPGTLSYVEFERLWGTMDSWRKMFETADRDRSGKLTSAEVKTSVRSLSFTCPDAVLDAVFRAYDDDGSGSLGFDEYMRLLAELTTLTNTFRRYDTSGTGSAMLTYNQFLEIVFSSRS